MAYLDVGRGPPLLCVHGSLCDFRIWSSVLGPLSKQHRLIAPSLRHFFPAHWDGVGDTYSIAQHVDDLIGFIEKLDAGPVDLMGHSRGGHISFRVAQRRPDLLRRLILAEPGGELDVAFDPEYKPGPSPLAAGLPHAPPSSPRAISTAGSRFSWMRWKVPAPGSACPPRRSNSCVTTPSH
jgi:pimeloyl-ACP methyl ester carboxylesterase